MNASLPPIIVERVERFEREQVAAMRARTDAIAQRFGLAVRDEAPRDGHYLVCGPEGLELRDASQPRSRGIAIDFAKRWRMLKSQRGGASQRQPLARAIGRPPRRVLDATAGLGQDAALLALLGHDVTMIERHAALAALLDDAVERASRADDDAAAAMASRLRLIHGDARRFIIDAPDRFDCIYIDPMFPPKRKSSALAKRSIRIVRELVGSDDDAAELLAIARRHAARIVLKRADDGPPLVSALAPTLAEPPAASFGGKLVRYDVYHGRA